MNRVEINEVWLMYKIPFICDGKISWDNFWALKDITFNVEAEETLGIIGENGAGKSSILKLIYGLLSPDRGRIEIKGKTAGLLELGAGFQTELSGRENVYANASLYGTSRRQLEQKYENIIAFAGLGKFINAPIKFYSQGMFVRLAFAIAVHMDPDIFLIDDTLAVGDEYFQKKCIKKIFELKEKGKTILCVSHDTNILKKLCSRALFIKEGRVVKDGKIEDVRQFYTQTAGEKSGVEILGQKNLQIVFNNGNLFINWQGRLLTPPPGIHTAFRIGDIWYSSQQAHWVVEVMHNKLIAKGFFYALSLWQIWVLELIEDKKALSIHIEFESQQLVTIQEGCVNLMVCADYDGWFNEVARGEFPPFNEENRQWDALLSAYENSKCLGVKCKSSPDKQVPSLACEKTFVTALSYSQIFNGTYFDNYRVLQYRQMCLTNYSQFQIDRVMFFSGTILVDITDINNYLAKLVDETILSSEKLKIKLESGQLSIFFDRIRLTKINNVFTKLYANEKWFLSETAYWKRQKTNKNKIIAEGRWPQLPLLQRWELELTSGHSFTLKVEMEVFSPIEIPEQAIRFLCSEKYDYYTSNCGQGKFPERFSETEMDMLQRCVPAGELGLQSKQSIIPKLALKFSADLNNYAKIFNSDLSNRARILSLEKIEPEHKTRFEPGRYPCFNITGTISQTDIKINHVPGILQKEKLMFSAGNGSGHLYWQDTRLTKRLGLYASLRANGRWYDSCAHASWESKVNNDTLEMFGRWYHLPIRQHWRIQLSKPAELKFTIMLIVDEQLETDRLQTNIMLSESYDLWFTDGRKGEFPDFKRDVVDDWDMVWSEPSADADINQYIAASSTPNKNLSLPDITFFKHTADPGWCLHVVNSDVYHRARVLQSLKRGPMVLPAGEYLYHQGKILIEEI